MTSRKSVFVGAIQITLPRPVNTARRIIENNFLNIRQVFHDKKLTNCICCGENYEAIGIVIPDESTQKAFLNLDNELTVFVHPTCKECAIHRNAEIKSMLMEYALGDQMAPASEMVH